MQTDTIISQLTEDLKPAHKMATPVSLFIRTTLGLLLYVCVLVYFEHARPDIMQQLGNPFYLTEIISLLFIIAGSAYSVALLAFPDSYQRKFPLLFPVLAFAVFVCVLAMEYGQDNSPLPSHGIECLTCILVFCLPPIVFMLYPIRNYATTHPIMAGILSTLTAFSTSALALRISEQTNSIVHLLTWHYVPMLGIAIIGAILGKIVLKW